MTNKKNFSLSNEQVVKKHFSKVNREGLGFLEGNMSDCVTDLNLNTLALINESFDEVIAELKEHTIAEKDVHIIQNVRDLIINIVNRRLTNNGK